jgi:hypothetical protein
MALGYLHSMPAELPAAGLQRSGVGILGAEPVRALEKGVHASTPALQEHYAVRPVLSVLCSLQGRRARQSLFHMKLDVFS